MQTDEKEDEEKSDQHLSKSVSDEGEKGNISQTEFRQILVHRIKSKSECAVSTKTSKEPLDLSVGQHDGADGVGTDSTGADDNVVSSSSDDSQSEQEIGPLFENLVVINDNVENQRVVTRFEVRRLSSLLTLFFTHCAMTFRAIRHSRSRMILTLFWFLYGGIIVFISRAFLPWMSFYTIIYFVIIYAELQPPEAFE